MPHLQDRFINILFFTKERESTQVCEQRGRVGEGEKISSRFSTEGGALPGAESPTPEIMT